MKDVVGTQAVFRPLLEEFEYNLESGKTYTEQLGIDYPTVGEQ